MIVTVIDARSGAISPFCGLQVSLSNATASREKLALAVWLLVFRSGRPEIEQVQLALLRHGDTAAARQGKAELRRRLITTYAGDDAASGRHCDSKEKPALSHMQQGMKHGDATTRAYRELIGDHDGLCDTCQNQSRHASRKAERARVTE